MKLQQFQKISNLLFKSHNYVILLFNDKTISRVDSMNRDIIYYMFILASYAYNESSTFKNIHNIILCCIKLP